MNNNLSSKINTYISERPFILAHLQEKITNINALAQKIITELNLSENVLTVAMTLRRMKVRSENLIQDKIQIKQILSESSVSLERNLVEIRIQDEDVVQSIDKSDFIDFVKSKRELGLVMDKPRSAKFLSKNKKTKEKLDVNCITITLPPRYKNIHSLYYLILREFSTRGINILSFRTVFDDIKIYLSNDMVDKAYQMLNEILDKE